MESPRALIENSLKLHYLYHLEMFGEEYCQDFNQNTTEKSKASLGLNPQHAKMGFITQMPLLKKDLSFLPTKSAKMLQDIITHLFSLSIDRCSILSLFKNQIPSLQNPQEIEQYAQILKAQIAQSQAKVFIIFGDQEVGEHLFPKTPVELGMCVKTKTKNFIITHSLTALIRLPHLKKQTLQHLKNAKALL